MKELIEIDHLFAVSKKYFFVSCVLGNTCNYSCSYCDKRLNDGSLPWIKYNNIIKFMENLKNHVSSNNKIPVFEFQGGEITFYKDLPKVLAEAKKIGAKTSIITNGSKSFAYFEQIIPNLDTIVISFHSENADKEKFIDTVTKIAKNTKPSVVNVDIMFHPEHFDLCLEVGNILVKENVHVNFQSLFRNLTNDHTLLDYSEEQLAKIKDLQKRGNDKCNNNPSAEMEVDETYLKGTMKNYYSDGTTDYCNPESYIFNGTNKWAGWSCYAGVENMVLAGSGDLFRAWCCQDHLGNLNQNNYTFPSDPAICRTSICHCLADIMLRRKKIIKLERSGSG